VRHVRDLLLVVKAVVGVLTWARIEILDDVVCLRLEQMVVTVFNEKVSNFFAADVPFVFSVDSAEGRIWLEIGVACQRLPHALNVLLVLGDHDHEAGQFRSHYGCHFLEVALLVAVTSLFHAVALVIVGG